MSGQEHESIRSTGPIEHSAMPSPSTAWTGEWSSAHRERAPAPQQGNVMFDGLPLEADTTRLGVAPNKGLGGGPCQQAERVLGFASGRCRSMIEKTQRSADDIAADLIAMMRASGPHWKEIDRTDVARQRGVPLDADPWLRGLLMRTVDLLAFATVRVAARQGTTYDQVVDEWEAVMAEDARRAASLAKSE
jgi:hypothetical protein